LDRPHSSPKILLAGLGAALIFLTTSLNRSLLAGTLSFSAGVMVYVSLVEVIGVSTEYFRKGYSEPLSEALATASFFGGVILMAIVDRIVHAVFTAVSSGDRTSDGPGENSSSVGTGAEGSDSEGEGLAIGAVGRIAERRRLLAMSAIVSAAIVLHNIPEGMATYVASFHSVNSGLPLAAAIAVHNIPEGACLTPALPTGTSSFPPHRYLFCRGHGNLCRLLSLCKLGAAAHCSHRSA
jgi:ZIP family zinc transporter